MGCSCNKKGNISVQRNRAAGALKPVSSAPSTPTSLVKPTPKRSSSGEAEEKKKVQKIRREAIKRALGKY